MSIDMNPKETMYDLRFIHPHPIREGEFIKYHVTDLNPEEAKEDLCHEIIRLFENGFAEEKVTIEITKREEGVRICQSCKGPLEFDIDMDPYICKICINKGVPPRKTIP